MYIEKAALKLEYKEDLKKVEMEYNKRLKTILGVGALLAGEIYYRNYSKKKET